MEEFVSDVDASKISIMAPSVKGIIRVSMPSDMIQLKHLRLTEFLSSNEFSVIKSEEVATDEYDANDINLVICDGNNNIIATMRGCIIQNKAHAYERFHFELPLADKDFPALYLSKAATANNYRNQGLNSLLRYYFFTLLPNSTIKSVIGYVYEGAPRVPLLKTLDYVFYDVTYHKFNDLRTRTKAYVAHLGKDKFDLAIQRLKRQNEMIFHSYPWCGHNIRIDNKYLTIIII